MPAPRTPDFIEEFRCTSYPTRLYRVQHSNSQAQFNDGGDLVPQLSDYIPTDEADFGSRIQLHVQDEPHEQESCFMSVFGNAREALRFARRQYLITTQTTGLSTEVKIYEIETRYWFFWIFKLDEVRQRLELAIERSPSSEYLVLGRVPGRAIGFWLDVGAAMREEEEINYDGDNELRLREESSPDRGFDSEGQLPQ